MASETEKLVLQVDATVELARRELQRMSGEVERFARTTDRQLTGVQGSFAKIETAAATARTALVGFVSGIGIAGVAQLGRSILQLGDDLEAAANQANVGVERYQTLREGLRALELSTEQTDQVLKRLSATLGDVQGGNAAGGVVDALTRMGVQSKILSGEIETTDQLLDAIAASSRNYATEAQFTADVVDIVGRKVGIDLAAALRDGGAALKESEQAFRDAGAVISEDYVARLAEANETIDSFISRSRSRLAIWSADVITYVGQAGEAWTRYYESQGAVSFNQAQRDINNERRLNRTSDALGSGSGTGAFRLDPALPRPSLPGGTAGPVGGGSTRAQRGGRITRATPRSALRSLLDDNDGGFAGVASRVTDEAGDGGSLSTAVRDLEELRRAAERASDAISAPFERAREFTRGITDDIGQAVIFSQNIGDALVNSFKAAAAEAISSRLFDLLLGSNGQGGVINSLVAAFGSSFGGARASGGPVMGGKAYLVGERGPEIFMPGAAGAIIPNGASVGGGTMVFDMRGAVVTEQLLADVNQRVATGTAYAIGVSRSDMAGARRTRLPRSAGA